MRIRSIHSAYQVSKQKGICGYGRRALAIKELRGLPLSPREEQVLQFAADDMSTSGIAGRLRISEKTVSYHKANILLRMGKHSICACVAEGIRKQIIT